MIAHSAVAQTAIPHEPDRFCGFVTANVAGIKCISAAKLRFFASVPLRRASSVAAAWTRGAWQWPTREPRPNHRPGPHGLVDDGPAVLASWAESSHPGRAWGGTASGSSHEAPACRSSCDDIQAGAPGSRTLGRGFRPLSRVPVGVHSGGRGVRPDAPGVQVPLPPPTGSRFIENR